MRPALTYEAYFSITVKLEIQGTVGVWLGYTQGGIQLHRRIRPGLGWKKIGLIGLGKNFTCICKKITLEIENIKKY